jgi:hypothetical protein
MCDKDSLVPLPELLDPEDDGIVISKRPQLLKNQHVVNIREDLNHQFIICRQKQDAG